MAKRHASERRFFLALRLRRALAEDEKGKKEADDDRSHDVEQEAAGAPGLAGTLHDCLDAGSHKKGGQRGNRRGDCRSFSSGSYSAPSSVDSGSG